MLRKLGFKVFVLLIPFLCTLAHAHPHPVMYIEAKPNDIRILALHWQVVDLQYLQENFVLEDCNYSIFMQDPFRYYDIETDISIYHNCSELKIKKNTLFKDYWGDIPILVQTEGFDDSKEELPNYDNSKEESIKYESSKNENIPKSFFSFEEIKLPDNPVLLLLMLFPLGGFFAFAGDFFNLVLPITLSSKNSRDDLLWLKAGIVHLVSTYIVLFLSLNFLAKTVLRYNGFIVAGIGGLMLLENYLKRKNVSPLLFALIPCSAALFVSTVIFKDNLLFAYLAPLIMGIGEILVLKLGSFVPCPKKLVRFVPYVIIILGIFLMSRIVYLI